MRGYLAVVSGCTFRRMEWSYASFVLEQLRRVAPVSGRRMFGGMGIYSGPHCFALVGDDRLFFKVDDSNRADFEARGMEPFRPYGDERAMQYYELPVDVLEDAESLREWVDRAIAVAQRAKQGKQAKRRHPGRR